MTSPNTRSEEDREMGEHTPTPWKVRDNGETIFVRAPDGSNLAQITFLTRAGRRPADVGAANARRIVHCVNNYDKVVEALATVKKYCHDTMVWNAILDPDGPSNDPANTLGGLVNDALRALNNKESGNG